jgi:hypothetical protein
MSMWNHVHGKKMCCVKPLGIKPQGIRKSMCHTTGYKALGHKKKKKNKHV